MDLLAQAQIKGVQSEFVDALGKLRVTDPVALKSILDALPEKRVYRFVSGPVVVRALGHPRTELAATGAPPLQWKIAGNGNVIAQGETREPVIAWPAGLPLGYHRLTLTDAEGVTEEVPMIVAPERAFGGDFDRGWLLAVQLYGVRSERNWGIGDFTDLADLVRLAKQLGADGVGLNPLHVLFDDHPADCSPYSPNSRLFLNPLYIDVEAIPEFSADLVPDAAATAARLREGDRVPYADMAALKWLALRAAFNSFVRSASGVRRNQFDAFRADRAPLLSRFACFEVLRHRFTGPWWEWPPEWRQPDETKCARLRNGPDKREVEFVEFVQWTADSQLHAAKELAGQLGMRVGLYLDVAVGVQSNGFDAWNEQTAISRHLAVGAPPDVLNTVGQDWGLAGFNAGGLEAQSFVPFADMLAASMRHAGAIRIDHVLGLKRLYLVPRGFKPDNGAYVQMPFEALLGAVARESAAHKCIVIGEDLGTVPEGFRETMQDFGIWSYLVMMFERDDAGHFRNIDYYRPNALVTLNTHDLCTYAGWRSFSDLKMKLSLGLDPGEDDKARWHALGMLDEILRQNGINANDLYSVLAFLSRTPSRLLAVSLEDLLGVIDQPNIPGTIDEHPNWRQRLPVTLDKIASKVDLTALRAATRERSLLGGS
ncbi:MULTISPECIES: 4-alpha-glucanotransferase [Bradyrhizobium]|uniref:4-alpha-glucanotransferase n=2 Tax=Bradyrhizobium diazoefficiens TaxID=1355477 RepID=Q89FD6_BRADU|nr:4-alpha-glucanotransferase [Bradyrhizobium diazoefficiens]MBP1062981.1 4-alpha-glucanotransferase [Bradyrhizobium japonicum]AND91787.1 4-alpha-glucanotransferase [Bradyrhizobium diazoefficiens USDA 110]APO51000.1 4-alpha-glucanotransferase [Bradyrhizobium diazoefficiens]KGJ67178.1 putative 4-alpha-glucanotransferase [Bradyrhizobium diazoefficiens SEMIA 5080]KOY05362.1 4-alpha-glucanotransferase [Bradyrhizobium diazoefficiens]